jgi:hypothetical protein
MDKYQVETTLSWLDQMETQVVGFIAKDEHMNRYKVVSGNSLKT